MRTEESALLQIKLFVPANAGEFNNFQIQRQRFANGTFTKLLDCSKNADIAIADFLVCFAVWV